VLVGGSARQRPVDVDLIHPGLWSSKVRCAGVRWTSTWALTLTDVVEIDVAVDVEPIVDLYLDHRSRCFR